MPQGVPFLKKNNSISSRVFQKKTSPAHHGAGSLFLQSEYDVLIWASCSLKFHIRISDEIHTSKQSTHAVCSGG